MSASRLPHKTSGRDDHDAGMRDKRNGVDQGVAIDATIQGAASGRWLLWGAFHPRPTPGSTNSGTVLVVVWVPPESTLVPGVFCQPKVAGMQPALPVVDPGAPEPCTPPPYKRSSLATGCQAGPSSVPDTRPYHAQSGWLPASPDEDASAVNEKLQPRAGDGAIDLTALPAGAKGHRKCGSGAADKRSVAHEAALAPGDMCDPAARSSAITPLRGAVLGAPTTTSSGSPKANTGSSSPSHAPGPVAAVTSTIHNAIGSSSSSSSNSTAVAIKPQKGTAVGGKDEATTSGLSTPHGDKATGGSHKGRKASAKNLGPAVDVQPSREGSESPGGGNAPVQPTREGSGASGGSHGAVQPSEKDMDPRVAALPQFSPHDKDLRRKPREKVRHDNGSLFKGFGDWVLVPGVTSGKLGAFRRNLPKEPGLYEWAARPPGPEDQALLCFYLGKTGSLVKENKETLQSRFLKYTKISSDYVGPWAELPKYALFVELQRRGFTLFYRYRICSDMEPETMETQLLLKVNYAANDAINGGRRALLLGSGRTLADYRVVTNT